MRLQGLLGLCCSLITLLRIVLTLCQGISGFESFQGRLLLSYG